MQTEIEIPETPNTTHSHQKATVSGAKKATVWCSLFDYHFHFNGKWKERKKERKNERKKERRENRPLHRFSAPLQQ